jgi:pimeloyl-ACP methyl ester carboxylesterase
MPELVLLLGLLCDDDLWRDQEAALRSVVPCRVADFTHGETLAELAHGVLEAAAPQFALAAFSLGGYVAQEILRQAPARVERLALLDTSFRADTPERQAERRALVAAARQPGRFAGITNHLLASFIHPDRLRDPALVGRIKAMTQRMGREVFIRQNMMQRVDGEAVLRALDCPALVLCGKQDILTPVRDHEEMAAMIPRASLVTVEACGHMAPMEQPAAVTDALHAWLGA